VHSARLTSIPFESLDPRCWIPVSLAPEDLERKLVPERRGGYCFEQNLVLKAALETLGAEVDLLLARGRVSAPLSAGCCGASRALAGRPGPAGAAHSP
jgi:arylamine N-acetyltransferase